MLFGTMHAYWIYVRSNCVFIWYVFVFSYCNVHCVINSNFKKQSNPYTKSYSGWAGESWSNQTGPSSSCITINISKNPDRGMINYQQYWHTRWLVNIIFRKKDRQIFKRNVPATTAATPETTVFYNLNLIKKKYNILYMSN